MLFRSIMSAGALGLFAADVSAQGYNTLVVEIPYEISLPAHFRSATLFCENAFGVPGEILRKEHTIELVNGQASGSISYGWGANGSGPGLDVVAPEGTRIKSASPDFEIRINCEFIGFHSENRPGANPRVKSNGGVYFIGDFDDLILLEGDSDPSKLDVTLTHASNGLIQKQPTATTFVEPENVPAGLQGLQSILEAK